jgi:hypothetical protein
MNPIRKRRSQAASSLLKLRLLVWCLHNGLIVMNPIRKPFRTSPCDNCWHNWPKNQINHLSVQLQKSLRPATQNCRTQSDEIISELAFLVSLANMAAFRSHYSCPQGAGWWKRELFRITIIGLKTRFVIVVLFSLRIETTAGIWCLVFGF